MVSAVGSLRREPCRSRGEAAPGGFGGSPPGSDSCRIAAPRPLCGQADAEVVNSTGPWLGPAFAVSGSALPPLLVGSSTVAGAPAAGDPAHGRRDGGQGGHPLGLLAGQPPGHHPAQSWPTRWKVSASSRSAMATTSATSSGRRWADTVVGRAVGSSRAVPAPPRDTQLLPGSPIAVSSRRRSGGSRGATRPAHRLAARRRARQESRGGCWNRATGLCCSDHPLLGAVGHSARRPAASLLVATGLEHPIAIGCSTLGVGSHAADHPARWQPLWQPRRYYQAVQDGTSTAPR